MTSAATRKPQRCASDVRDQQVANTSPTRFVPLRAKWAGAGSNRRLKLNPLHRTEFSVKRIAIEAPAYEALTILRTAHDAHTWRAADTPRDAAL